MSKKSSKINGQKLTSGQLKKEVHKLFRRQAKKVLNPRQIIKKLQVANNVDSVQHVLDLLVKDNELRDLGNFRYQLNRSQGPANQSSGRTAVGKVDMTRTGAAYIVVDGIENDIFVAPRNVNTALHGDMVKIRYWTPRGRRKPEGEVLEVTERSADTFVGVLNIFARFALVAMEGKLPVDIMVDLGKLNGAQEGDLVVVKIVEWSAGRYNHPVGEVTLVLGRPGTSSIEMQAILINKGFDPAFPENVLHEAAQLPETISEEEIAQRRDFREVTTFTIDPVDAKDFDDALSVRHLDHGEVEIGVHIADVSHYVKPDSALDKEAYERSTSVYLVDRVCPMLPERLSNELCSLRPKEDKLTFSATFVFDKDFKVRRRWFGRGIIHSDHRFAYEGAQEVLDKGEGDFHAELNLLNNIAKVLRERRFRRGSIDFAGEEVRFRLAEDGTPLEVYVKESHETNKLIEEFMLLANREVATYISRKESARNEKIPFVYRVHDDPDPDKAEELASFARALGFDMDVSSGEAIAKSYNRLIKASEKDPALKMLAPLAIRTMAKAIYTTENIGHYGLGFAHYTHFTSPIRRYSDVLVHRILDKNLGRGAIHKVNPKRLDEQCKHISSQEKKAAEAERESIKYKQVEFIEKHVGEVFPGTVNGLADFGVFVELTDSRCEGMISFERMDQPYEMGDGRLSIKGRRDGQVIRMGDTVQVRVIDTDLKRRRIEMELVKGPEQRNSRGGSGSSNERQRKQGSSRRRKSSKD